MTDTDDKLRSPVAARGTGDDGLEAIHPPPNEPPSKAKDHSIHVSPAVLEAAGKDGEELLRYLRTSPAGRPKPRPKSDCEPRVRTR